MSIQQKILGLIIGLFIILACGATAPAAAPDTNNVETIVVATLQAITQEASQNPTQLSGIPVSFQNISFIIPEGLATGAQSEIIPLADETTNSDPWSIAPEHMRFTLSRTDAFPSNFDMKISIIPVNEYTQMNAGAAAQIPLLQQKLSSGDFSKVVVLPPYNASLIIDSQNTKVDFPNGSGVRSIQEYHQGPMPITNDYLIYSFQGITNDGKYYVSVVAPIRVSFLIDETFNPDPNASVPTPIVPNGGFIFPTVFPFDSPEYDQYYQAVAGKLSQTPPDQFTPPISTLDKLIQSIQIQ